MLVYLLIVFGPLLMAAAAFAVRDRLARPRPSARPAGNGRAEDERLADTLEEVRAP